MGDNSQFTPESPIRPKVVKQYTVLATKIEVAVDFIWKHQAGILIAVTETYTA